MLDLTAPYKPAMASLTLGSMNFPKQASVNTPEVIVRLAKRMAEQGLVPELEVFDMGMIDYFALSDRKKSVGATVLL